MDSPSKNPGQGCGRGRGRQPTPKPSIPAHLVNQDPRWCPRCKSWHAGTDFTRRKDRCDFCADAATRHAASERGSASASSSQQASQFDFDQAQPLGLPLLLSQASADIPRIQLGTPIVTQQQQPEQQPEQQQMPPTPHQAQGRVPRVHDDGHSLFCRPGMNPNDTHHC